MATHGCVWLYDYIQYNIYIYIHIYIGIHMYIYIYIHICIYIYTYVYMYTYIHTYTHCCCSFSHVLPIFLRLTISSNEVFAQFCFDIHHHWYLFATWPVDGGLIFGFWWYLTLSDPTERYRRVQWLIIILAYGGFRKWGIPNMDGFC